MRFLGFVVLAQEMKIEEERIEFVNIRPEPRSVRDIQIFLGFANVYKKFVRNISRIAASLISMLQITSKLTGLETGTQPQST